MSPVIPEPTNNNIVGSGTVDGPSIVTPVLSLAPLLKPLQRTSSLLKTTLSLAPLPDRLKTNVADCPTPIPPVGLPPAPSNALLRAPPSEMMSVRVPKGDVLTTPSRKVSKFRFVVLMSAADMPPGRLNASATIKPPFAAGLVLVSVIVSDVPESVIDF